MSQYIKRKANMSRRDKAEEGNMIMEGRSSEHNNAYTGNLTYVLLSGHEK
jgi:hypothetical protein